MTSPLRLALRILFLVVVVLLLVIGGVLAVFTSWRSDRLAALESASEIAKTSAGATEFQIRGEGPSVLVFHDAPGGYDQAALYGESLADDGLQVIAPSRPGYLRTPLTTGLLPMQQADAMAALLDTIGLKDVAVLGVGDGGPAAAEFALRHPDRLRSLVLVSSVYKDHPADEKPRKGNSAEWVLRTLTGDIGSWLAVEGVRKNPRKILDWMLQGTMDGDEALRRQMAGDILARPEQLEWFANYVGTFAPLSPREVGARNDQFQVNSLRKIPYEQIKAPVLVIHGQLDLNSPLSEAEQAAGRIPNATFFPVEGTGALVELGPKGAEVRKKIIDFIKQHPGGSSQP